MWRVEGGGGGGAVCDGRSAPALLRHGRMGDAARRPPWVAAALAAAAAVGAAIGALAATAHARRFTGPERPGVVPGLAGLCGGTPLVRIASLSEATGREVTEGPWGAPSFLPGAAPAHRPPSFLHRQIYGKAEFLNPGGSVKDRVALSILRAATAAGALAPGGVVTEGTSGER